MRRATAFSMWMSDLARRYLMRLRLLARGPRTYGITDTVNPPLVRRGLIIPTNRDLGRYRREYEIREAGRIALQDQANAIYDP